MGFRNRVANFGLRKILNSSLSSTVDEIHIGNIKESNDGFEEIIVKALDLIRDHDPRRYKRVKREIDWIVNSSVPAKFGGMYKRSVKACLMHFENYSEDSRLVSAFYAGIIVHESTHGFIYTKGYEYSEDNRLQIERICFSENNRFYKRIENAHPEYDGLLTRDFVPSDWEYSWETPGWKQFWHWLKRETKD